MGIRSARATNRITGEHLIEHNMGGNGLQAAAKEVERTHNPRIVIQH